MRKVPDIVNELRAEEQAGRLISTHQPHTTTTPQPPTTDEDTDTPIQTTIVRIEPPTPQPKPTKQTKQQQPTATFSQKAILASPTAIAITDSDGIITYTNPSFQHLWGYDPTDLTTTPLDTHIKVKTKAPLLPAVLATGRWTGEATGIKKNKTTIPLQLTGTRIDDTDGPRILFTCTDITPYKTAIKDLTDSQRRFQTILDNSQDILYKINLKKQAFDYISPSTQTILGYSADEIITWTLTTVADHIPNDDRQTLKPLFTHQAETYLPKQDTSQIIEFRFQKKNKDYCWLSNTSITLYDAQHRPQAIVGTIEDITTRHKIWDDLVKSEERYRILAETSADGVFTTDALGRITYTNPAFERLLGHPKEKILANPLRNFLLEDSIYFLQQLFLDIHKTNEKIENIELELVAATNTIIPIEVNMAPLMKDNEFQGVVCTVRDIVQRREIEAELRKNERLKTEFMNIAAHELRSPVTPIKGYLDLILHDPDANDKLKNWAKISLRNADRLLKLVNDILDVARLDSDTMRFEMEKLDTNELLKEVAEDVKPAISTKHLTFDLNIAPDIPHILGDKNRMSQVMKNLIGNALKFTDTGCISLTAIRHDSTITITVSDTGIGISKEELKKIFTKFYQAYTGEDRNNEGTGLGLFISKEIVKKHNGRIWAESEVGKGSSFIIELPYIHKMTVDFHPQLDDHANKPK
jgi:PAS domain S-box-containing protein